MAMYVALYALMWHLVAVHELECFEQAAGDVFDDVQREASLMWLHLSLSLLQNLLQALPWYQLKKTVDILETYGKTRKNMKIINHKEINKS
jgi:hypothetical protein